jgi:hypothetical protein
MMPRPCGSGIIVDHVTFQDRSRLAYMRYRGGVGTLLNALDADRDLFEAELGLAQNATRRATGARAALSRPQRWLAVIRLALPAPTHSCVRTDRHGTPKRDDECLALSLR